MDINGNKVNKLVYFTFAKKEEGEDAEETSSLLQTQHRLTNTDRLSRLKTRIGAKVHHSCSILLHY
jgi:hypothetical protein